MWTVNGLCQHVMLMSTVKRLCEKCMLYMSTVNASFQQVSTEVALCQQLLLHVNR